MAQKNEKINKKMAALGSLLGTDNDALAVIAEIEKWLIKVGMPTDLKEIGIKVEDIDGIEEYALGDPCRPLNPKPVLKGDVKQIIENLLQKEYIFMIKAITFDLWDTVLIDNSDEPKRKAAGRPTKAIERRRSSIKAT